MAEYKLNIKYVYTFYNSGEVESEEVFDESYEVYDKEYRFTLHDQEDGSFILGALCSDFLGKYVTVTFPGKDILIVHDGESVELEYDEYYSAMGDDNHNVYVGSITLTKI